MNNFKVEIFDNETKTYVDYTSYAVFPFKFANFLDEQLDEAHIELKSCPVATFQPLTRVRVTLTNKPDAELSNGLKQEIKDKSENNSIVYTDNGNKLAETYEMNMLIANDRSIEIILADKKVYSHQLYIIEQTKILEGLQLDSLTFTNSLGSNYGAEGEQPPVYFTLEPKTAGGEYFTNIYTDLVKPIMQKDTIYLPSMMALYENIKPQINNGDISNNYKPIINYPQGVYIREQTTNELVYFDETVREEATYEGRVQLCLVHKRSDGLKEVIGSVAESASFSIPETNTKLNNIGNYSVEYLYYPRNAIGTGGEKFYHTTSMTIYAVENKLPLKKWTVPDVIGRICDLSEPLAVYFSGIEKPRLRLAQKYIDKYKDIITPEFSLTRMNVREALKIVGGFVHAEPRILREVKNKKEQYFEIGFDEYGSDEFSGIADEVYDTATFGTDINQYCTALDTNASNLVNSIDWAQGVTIEPFDGGYKTLRTDTTTVRFAEDDNTFIPTTYPIHQLGGEKSVKVLYKGKFYDITPYIYEKADYDLLSSYEGNYPYVKAYALYYTQDSKSIKGLFFKNADAVSSYFQQYAIVNILRAVTGDANLNFDSEDNSIFDLSFQVTYLPIYNARVKTYKGCIIKGLPFALTYNQGANLIENRYFGEHLKGVVERLGNIEKTYTYNLAYLSQIPKAGLLFDNDYYISIVSVEYLPTIIKCTITLSKDFNRRSQYVGIDSLKHMYEISEKQSQARQSTFSKFIRVGETPEETKGYSGTISGYPAEWLFNRNNALGAISQVTSATIERLTKSGKSVIPNYITLPVVSTSSGNSMAFVFDFVDNYTAGQKVVDQQGAQGVRGKWGAYVPYNDYYGRFYRLKTTLNYNMKFGSNAVSSNATPQSLPQDKLDYKNDHLPDFLTTDYIYRKDSREIPQITHQIVIKTDNRNIIIGSGMCRNCRAVNAQPLDYELWLLGKRLNAINSNVDLTGAIKVTTAFNVSDYELTLPAIKNASQYKGWAIITKPTTKTQQVEDEDGNITTQIEHSGGELVIGQNIPLADNTEKKIYFTFKNKLEE